jgi:8-oxo-dGTP diphosphatase
MINCIFENGGKASLRHVTVVAIARNTEGKILLTKRAQHLLRGGKWTIPGGFLDRDESTSEGVKREIREETGLTTSDIILFRINDAERPKEDRQNVDFIFLATVNGKLKEDIETIGFKWVDEKTLPPDEDFAFDHRESILKYFQHLKEPLQLPIIG